MDGGREETGPPYFHLYFVAVGRSLAVACGGGGGGGGREKCLKQTKKESNYANSWRRYKEGLIDSDCP